MNPLTWLRFGRPDIDHGHAVVVGVGDVKRIAVGRDGQGVGRAPLGREREKCREDRLGDHAAQGVDHRDAVARRTGDEDPVVLRVDGELVGVLADRDLGQDPKVARTHGDHGAVGPVGDVEPATVAVEGDVIRALGDLCGRWFVVAPGERLSGDRAVIDVEREEIGRAGVERQPAAEVLRPLGLSALLAFLAWPWPLTLG